MELGRIDTDALFATQMSLVSRVGGSGTVLSSQPDKTRRIREDDAHLSTSVATEIETCQNYPLPPIQQRRANPIVRAHNQTKNGNNVNQDLTHHNDTTVARLLKRRVKLRRMNSYNATHHNAQQNLDMQHPKGEKYAVLPRKEPRCRNFSDKFSTLTWLTNAAPELLEPVCWGEQNANAAPVMKSAHKEMSSTNAKGNVSSWIRKLQMVAGKQQKNTQPRLRNSHSNNHKRHDVESCTTTHYCATSHYNNKPPSITFTTPNSTSGPNIPDSSTASAHRFHSERSIYLDWKAAFDILFSSGDSKTDYGVNSRARNQFPRDHCATYTSDTVLELLKEQQQQHQRGTEAEKRELSSALEPCELIASKDPLVNRNILTQVSSTGTASTISPYVLADCVLQAAHQYVPPPHRGPRSRACTVVIDEIDEIFRLSEQHQQQYRTLRQSGGEQHTISAPDRGRTDDFSNGTIVICNSSTSPVPSNHEDDEPCTRRLRRRLLVAAASLVFEQLCRWGLSTHRGENRTPSSAPPVTPSGGVSEGTFGSGSLRGTCLGPPPFMDKLREALMSAIYVDYDRHRAQQSSGATSGVNYFDLELYADCYDDSYQQQADQSVMGNTDNYNYFTSQRGSTHAHTAATSGRNNPASPQPPAVPEAVLGGSPPRGPRVAETAGGRQTVTQRLQYEAIAGLTLCRRLEAYRRMILRAHLRAWRRVHRRNRRAQQQQEQHEAEQPLHKQSDEGDEVEDDEGGGGGGDGEEGDPEDEGESVIVVARRGSDTDSDMTMRQMFFHGKNMGHSTTGDESRTTNTTAQSYHQVCSNFTPSNTSQTNNNSIFVVDDSTSIMTKSSAVENFSRRAFVFDTMQKISDAYHKHGIPKNRNDHHHARFKAYNNNNQRNLMQATDGLFALPEDGPHMHHQFNADITDTGLAADYVRYYCQRIQTIFAILPQQQHQGLSSSSPSSPFPLSPNHVFVPAKPCISIEPETSQIQRRVTGNEVEGKEESCNWGGGSTADTTATSGSIYDLYRNKCSYVMNLAAGRRTDAEKHYNICPTYDHTVYSATAANNSQPSSTLYEVLTAGTKGALLWPTDTKSMVSLQHRVNDMKSLIPSQQHKKEMRNEKMDQDSAETDETSPNLLSHTASVDGYNAAAVQQKHRETLSEKDKEGQDEIWEGEKDLCKKELDHAGSVIVLAHLSSLSTQTMQQVYFPEGSAESCDRDEDNVENNFAVKKHQLPQRPVRATESVAHINCPELIPNQGSFHNPLSFMMHYMLSACFTYFSLPSGFGGHVDMHTAFQRQSPHNLCLMQSSPFFTAIGAAHRCAAGCLAVLQLYGVTSFFGAESRDAGEKSWAALFLAEILFRGLGGAARFKVPVNNARKGAHDEEKSIHLCESESHQNGQRRASVVLPTSTSTSSVVLVSPTSPPYSEASSDCPPQYVYVMSEEQFIQLFLPSVSSASVFSDASCNHRKQTMSKNPRSSDDEENNGDDKMPRGNSEDNQMRELFSCGLGLGDTDQQRYTLLDYYHDKIHSSHGEASDHNYFYQRHKRAVLAGVDRHRLRCLFRTLAVDINHVRSSMRTANVERDVSPWGAGDGARYEKSSTLVLISRPINSREDGKPPPDAEAKLTEGTQIQPHRVTKGLLLPHFVEAVVTIAGWLYGSNGCGLARRQRHRNDDSYSHDNNHELTAAECLALFLDRCRCALLLSLSSPTKSLPSFSS